ncbi:hypothetical protein [Streptomyces sp. ScaeMP-e48]|uniref:hypothetical protein n=1 Tax=Streptomyces sp. ScaeMP-e48 TaxID=1100823 RepID=UPI00117CB7EB|nr:hypothetical protein [Streptomyces sp. ScaeMP-e48]
MCIRVHYAPIGTAPPFDATTQTITLPPGLDREHTVTAARAVLVELAVPQAKFGALCFCGEPLDLAPLIPQQRTGEQAVTHGA